VTTWAFEQVLKAHGLLPRLVFADGRLRRCRTVDKPNKRNGAYVLYPDGYGLFMNWAADSNMQVWRNGAVDAVLSAQAQAEHEARRETARQAFVERTRLVRQQVQAVWQAAGPLRGGHPYLQTKGLDMQGCGCLRVDGANLLVPMFWGRGICSIQTIFPDGQKRFFTGASIRGCCLEINRPRAALTLLCEGLATGLALFQCVPTARVVVCFTAGNLLPVAQRLHAAGQLRGACVVCGDNDHATQARTGTNPGRQKAQEVAEVLGAGVAVPEGITGTDWADAMKEWIQECSFNNPRSSHERCRALVRVRINHFVTQGVQYVF